MVLLVAGRVVVTVPEPELDLGALYLGVYVLFCCVAGLVVDSEEEGRVVTFLSVPLPWVPGVL
ncbi:MAG: hypothetical protein LC655_05385, partial [Bacteroidales bacterium]|nr:hypothetical protein [Bacteroidales bacterium]